MTYRLLLPLLVLILTGCSGTWHPVPLDESDQLQAEQELYPRFLIVHDLDTPPGDELARDVDRILTALSPLMEGEPELDLVITNEPDADAGCLAGGKVFLSRGLVAWLQNADELLGAVALGATACGQASETWRQRTSTGFPEMDTQSWLFFRYRDYRLESIRDLYAQLVATGCGQRLDCYERAESLIREAGGEPAALHDLVRRIHEEWPVNALVDRFGAPPGNGSGPPPDTAWRASLGEIAEQKPSMDKLRDVQGYLLEGQLLPAYSAILEARQTDFSEFIAGLVYMRLNLDNYHPEYGLRDLDRVLALRPDYPDGEYYRGVARIQQGLRGEAREHFEASLEVLPRVSTHYYLGILEERRGNIDLAVEHFRQVIPAGEHHPHWEHADGRLVELDDSR